MQLQFTKQFEPEGGEWQQAAGQLPWQQAGLRQ
jgi:hypothetical protein